MPEKHPDKEILVEPSWPLLFDGYGYDSINYGGIPGVDQDGRKIVTLRIGPSSKARKRYNLQAEKDVDENGVMILIVLENDLVALNPYDKANERWLYVKSLRHEDTLINNREKFFKTELENKEKEILLLDAENINLHEQLNLAKTNPGKFMKQTLDLVEAVSKVMPDRERKQNE